MSNETSLPDFYASLFGLLMTSKHQLMDIGKDYDLTFIQASTLLLCSARAPKPMKTFQKIYNCDASNITGIIDGLEEKKLVTRGEKHDDRRVKVVLLTPAGIKLQKKLSKQLIRANDKTLSVLSAKERAQLQVILAKLSHFN